MKVNPHAVPVSVCIVAHNEQMNIARAIDSVESWAAEVIVLDCESTDRTGEIARGSSAIVHDAPNLVPEANKNRAFAYATAPWIFILDADEIMTEPLRKEIAGVIAKNPAENGFKVPRRNFYFGAPLLHGGNYPDRQLRLFRHGRGSYPGVGYHESLRIEGSVGALASSFDHHPYPTFEIWLSEFDRYTRFGAASLAERRVPINASTIRHQMITRPLRRWLERLFLKQGIRDGVPGVLAATFDLMTNVVSFGRYWMASSPSGPPPSALPRVQGRDLVEAGMSAPGLREGEQGRIQASRESPEGRAPASRESPEGSAPASRESPEGRAPVQT